MAGKISGSVVPSAVSAGAGTVPIPPSAKSRVPPAIDGIQVNFCKNPACGNYGVPPKPTAARGGSRKAPPAAPEPGAYIVWAAGAGYPVLKCKLCGEFPPIKSNLGVAEEVARQGHPSMPLPSPAALTQLA